METNVVKIKCPNCGGILVVRAKTLSPEMNITCKICNIPSPLKSYMQIEEQPQLSNKDDVTQLGVCAKNYVIGQLQLQGSELSPFQLKMGRNVIGREAKSSTADIQIPIQTTGRSRMSREHLIIDVDKVMGKGIVHHLFLYKANVNETHLNGEKLEVPDRIILKNGDVITLPEAKLIFEIPDEEGTVI